VDEGRLLALAASLERGSEHPLAAAIVAGAEERRVTLLLTEGFESLTGKGVRGRVGGSDVALGTRVLLQELGIDPGELLAEAEQLREDGQTAMFVAVDGKAAGVLGVADPIKETTAEAIHQLHEDGVRIVMLTGDSETTARAVPRSSGSTRCWPRCAPGQAAKVKELQVEGRFVAMAGDGINDAPALAQAQVGSPWHRHRRGHGERGRDPREGRPPGIVRARLLSRATMGNIQQNLFFAFVYNALGVPIAAGALYRPSASS